MESWPFSAPGSRNSPKLFFQAPQLINPRFIKSSPDRKTFPGDSKGRLVAMFQQGKGQFWPAIFGCRNRQFCVGIFRSISHQNGLKDIERLKDMEFACLLSSWEPGELKNVVFGGRWIFRRDMTHRWKVGIDQLLTPCHRAEIHGGFWAQVWRTQVHLAFCKQLHGKLENTIRYTIMIYRKLRDN